MKKRAICFLKFKCRYYYTSIVIVLNFTKETAPKKEGKNIAIQIALDLLRAKKQSLKPVLTAYNKIYWEKYDLLM